MGCGGCAKFILTTLNTLLLMLGLVPLIFGIIALASDDILATVIGFIPGTEMISDIVDLHELIRSSAIFLIVLGVILATIGFVGCCGACCQSKWLLIIYLLMMLVIILGEITVIVLAVAFPQTFSSGAVKLMKESLNDFQADCKGNPDTMSVDCSEVNAVSLAWHAMQFELKCCGAHNLSDYKTVTWNPRESSALAPLTCCAGLSSSNSSFPPTSIDNRHSRCISPGDEIDLYNSMGCFDALLNWIVTSPIVIGVLAAIGFLELVLLVMTIIQLRTISDEKKNSWKR